MEIKLDHECIEIVLKYDSNGVLEHVTNVKTGKKMIMTICQEGVGYEWTDCYGFKGCKAMMAGIGDLGIYVPKFIFLKDK